MLCGALGVLIGLGLLVVSAVRIGLKTRLTAAVTTLHAVLCMTVPALGILAPKLLLARYGGQIDVDVRDFFAQSAAWFEPFVWTLFALSGAALVTRLLLQRRAQSAT